MVALMRSNTAHSSESPAGRSSATCGNTHGKPDPQVQVLFPMDHLQVQVRLLEWQILT
jgi:hypothetical protein